MADSKLKIHQIILFIIEALENFGQPTRLDQLAIEINRLAEGHFSPNMIERTFLRTNPGVFKLLPDGRWSLCDWQEELSDSAAEIEVPEPIITRAIPLTPNQAFDHIKESVVQYLETAYRIS